MNRSLKIAIAIFVGLLAWFVIRSVIRGDISTQHEDVRLEASEVAPEAVTFTVSAQTHGIRLKAKGLTAPDKSVTVKAGTAGNVTSTPVREGTRVSRGTLLCGLDVEARAARLEEAEARRDAARIDFEAARTLAEKGLAPANNEASAKAALDAAEASVNAARVELSKTQIRAPFDGIFENRLAEAGDYLSPGQPCGTMVDMDPVIVAVEVAEANAGQLTTGMTGTARLPSGKTYPATLRYVSRTADAGTRTFLIEGELDTGDDPVAAGVTAELFIPMGEVPATLISPGLLTLSDAGELGVRYVDDQNTVQFAPIKVIDETPEGAWVTGLPSTVRLISIGQDYLAEGVEVKPVPQGGAQP
ncbi:efflux RND transporter periplasmic adaptor subunit [Hyphomonas sp. UBA4494]|uniref:efflux RND transporter periplasmic adaptor subunit n=1 Tax=Hyphomonas sp. UBA4494 TaxID=1946631 RepID=UPI0025C6C320|nr:efflux RND transporter periplasmic adaptor subunit [Hyphomonas sp. UBA4494]